MATISLQFIDRFIVIPRIFSEEKSPVRTFQRSDFDVALVSEILTRQGLEVEGYTTRGADLDCIVAGRIEKAEPHPNAGKLQVCQVDVGDGKLRQIVCGAPNARAGLHVAVALPGAKLPSNDGKTLEIKVSALRGVESQGMLCSRAELGLPINPDVDGDGLWEIQVDHQGGRSGSALSETLGLPVFDALGLRDVILEVNVLANRPDARTHEGIAREIEVGMKRLGRPTERRPSPFALPLSESEIVSQVHKNSEITTEAIRFSVDNELGVSAFFVVVEGVAVTPSPGWLRNLLESLGQNSINNVVDASNYILLAHGQPSHAFDIAKIAPSGTDEKKLFLRMAKESEKFTGLDGKERALTASDCVVADSAEAQALLGVIGGDKSKVDAPTRTIVIEFANADAVAVRKSSRRHARLTESSMMFEKGIDTVARCEAACKMLGLLGALVPQKPHIAGALHSRLTPRPPAAQKHVSDETMNQRLGPAAREGKSVDLSALAKLPSHPLVSQKEWSLWIQGRLAAHRHHLSRRAQLAVLGTELANPEESARILEWLGFNVKPNSEGLDVSTPHWRWLDIATNSESGDNGVPDLVEEMARVVGLDNLTEIPLPTAGTPKPDDDHLHWLERSIERAVALGYIEVAGFHFMREDDMDKLGLGGVSALGEPLALMNPIIRDEPLMHTTLIPDLLRKVGRNLSYGTKSGQLCHLCRTYQNLSIDGNRVFSDNGAFLGLAGRLSDAAAASRPLYDYDSRLALRFSRESDQSQRPAETPRLAGVAFGERVAKSWQTTGSIEWDLHTVMAHVAEIGKNQNVALSFETLPSDHPMAGALHPGRRVAVMSQVSGSPQILGWVAELHPKALRAFDVSTRAIAFELNLATLAKAASQAPLLRRSQASASRRFPSVSRDFAFVVPRSTRAASITEAVRQGAMSAIPRKVPAQVTQINIFDIYTGKGIPEGKMSIAVSVSLDPTERTLAEADIQAVSEGILESIRTNLQGELRS